MFRLFFIVIARFFLHLFWLFPVNKHLIIFSCYKGNQYSCSPKYIFLSLKQRFGDRCRYVWVYNHPVDGVDLKDVEVVKFMSVRYFFYICTCGIYFNNVFFEPFIPKRKQQLFINTWHGGGAYKGNSDSREKEKSMIIKDRLRDSITDYYISSCDLFSKCWTEVFSFEKSKFLSVGLPRNDILVNCANSNLMINKIKSGLGIDVATKVILFAPTWRFESRDKARSYTLDFSSERVVDTCKSKYGGNFIFLFRGHHCMKDVIIDGDNGSNIINVSLYPDMQELLLISNVFITDYSSSMWDFALTGRPGFLYTPDLIEYKNYQHFFTPIDTWPYEYASTFEELLSMIKLSNTVEIANRAMKHLSDFGSYERGNACSKICDIIGGRL